ncbi:MAG TPA: TIGR02594 family protein [Pseudolabrys sp.]|nr:TIGR02594 family protein [Pseudolabrys sp.]
MTPRMTKTVLASTSLALCSALLLALTTSADARPRHRHAGHQAGHHVKQHAKRHARQARLPVQAQGNDIAFNNDGKPTYVGPAMQSAPAARTTTQTGRKASRGVAAAQAHGSAIPSFTGSGLVSTARAYLGTNPTSRRTLWCGAFMDLVLRKSGHAGGGNLAKAYAGYGRRVSGPQVGAIAVMNRRGGGHVGVVSGVDANGNPIIISGNHNRTVAEAVYPRGRITAYVVPN